MKKHIIIFSLIFLSFNLLAQKDRLTPELLWSLGRVSLYDVSPDGQSVVYGVTYYDIEENNSGRDLYAVNKYGKDKDLAIRLTKTPEKEGNAQFRPDGKRIGYLKDGYLWEMNIDGADARQVSKFTMNGFKYAPDMSHILYINDVKYNKTTEEMYPDLPKANAKIIDELMYRHWDHWEDESFSNVFISKYDDGRVGGSVNIIGEPFDTPLSPFGGLEQINWTADGKKIAYVSKKLKGKAYAESTNSDIYLYDLESQKTTNLTSFNKGYDLDPVFSPDGRFMAWTSMEKEGYEADRYRVFTMELSTGEPREISREYDYNIHSPQWSLDGNSMYFTSERDGTQHIYEISTKGGDIRQLTKGTFNYYDFVVTKDALVARRASMSAPHEIYSISLNQKSQISQLTHVNEKALANIEMGKVESKIVKTTDGKNMHVWMIYPPNFDATKKYPALLYCQGGPQSQVSQFWSYRWNFQMMASNDYIVVAPNRRGLPGFGTKWNEEISGDWGGQPMNDYFSAIDEAAKEPYIDENRLGAVGASYGGYSVYWLAGNHKKRFKSFISHCGLFNLESWYGTTEELFFANQDIGGAYWEKNTPKSYAMDSPHKYVQNWDTPILVIHGGKDFRVPLSEGMQAFNVAQMRKIPSKFLYFPEESHWVLSPQNGILWQRVFFEWLDSALKEK